LARVELEFFGAFVIKQAPPEIIIQILDAINSFINHPLFVEYGKLGLFVNAVFSTFIPFPPELTAISLILAGNSRNELFIILTIGWIIGAALGYYAGLTGKKLVDIFKVRRRRAEKPTEVDAEEDNRTGLVGTDHKIHNNADNNNNRRNKKKHESRHRRYRELLERYGWAIIFIAPWIPVLGDIIPAIAGATKYDVKKFMIAISAGKTARAVVTIFLGSYIASIPVPPWL